MDLVKVDSVTPTWKIIGEPIRYYDSLLWNERFGDHSEFELKTRAVAYTLDELPLETVVTTRQSTEVMIVENHKIQTDANGIETLTVKGISLTSFIRHRMVGVTRGEKFKSFKHSNLASLCRLIENCFKNATTYNLTLQPPTTTRNPKDCIPNSRTTDSTGELEANTQGSTYQRWFTTGPAEGPIKELLLTRPYGFRAVRPSGLTSMIINVTSTGVFEEFPGETDIQFLCFDLFKGTNRSRNQTAVPQVIFDTDIDDLITPNYELSVANYKTAAHVALNDKKLDIFNRQSLDPNDPQDQKAGIHRRVLYVDGGDPEAGYDATEWDDFNTDRAYNLLDDHRQISAVEGSVSGQSRWTFGIDYFLGDLVSVRGKYGAISEARVDEYIRVEDEKGETGYPSLVYL